jgi:hypothetical protein
MFHSIIYTFIQIFKNLVILTITVPSYISFSLCKCERQLKFLIYTISYSYCDITGTSHVDILLTAQYCNFQFYSY